MFNINNFSVHVGGHDIGSITTSMSFFESIHGDINGMIHVMDNINFFDTFLDVNMMAVEISYEYIGKNITHTFYANGVTDQQIRKSGKEYNIHLVSLTHWAQSIKRICNSYSGTSTDILENLWKETHGQELKLIIETEASSKGKYLVPNMIAKTCIRNVINSAFDENNTGMFLYQRLTDEGITRMTSLHDMVINNALLDNEGNIFKIHNSYTDMENALEPVNTIGSSDSFELKSYNDHYVTKLGQGLWGQRITEVALDKTTNNLLDAPELTDIEMTNFKISENLYDSETSLFNSPSKANDTIIQNTKHRVFNTLLKVENVIPVPNLGCGMTVDVEQGGGNLSRTKSDGIYLVSSINHRYVMNDGDWDYRQNLSLAREGAA